MAATMGIFDIKEDEAKEVNGNLNNLMKKYLGEKDIYRKVVQDILKEENNRIKEIELFAFGFYLGSLE